MKPPHRPFVGLLLALIAGCAPDATMEGVIRRDSAGIAIVEYPPLNANPSPEWSLASEPAVSIGVVEGEEPYMFGSIGPVVRLRDGRIVITDGRAREIRFFDSAGRFLHEVGGDGEGPGEFRSVGPMRLGHGDTIFVWDGSLQRLTSVLLDGTIANVRPISTPPAVRYMQVLRLFDDGSLLLVTGTVSAQDFVGRVVQDTANYLRYIPEQSGHMDTVARVPSDGSYINDNASIWSVPFSSRGIVAIGGDRVYAMKGGAFTVAGMDRSGRKQLEIRIRETPAQVTAAHIEAYKAEEMAEAEDEGERASLRERFAELPFAETFPILDDLRADAAGNVWVRRYRSAPTEDQRWYVFSRDGSYLGSIMVPAPWTLLDIGRETVLVRVVDSLGVSSVRIHTLTRASRSP